MQNLGKKSQEWLRAVGIETLEQVEELGVMESYLRVKAAFPRHVTRNLLWGLQGAVMGLKWDQIPEDIRSSLLAEVEEREAQI
jgi:DNA transformation protein